MDIINKEETNKQELEEIKSLSQNFNQVTKIMEHLIWEHEHGLSKLKEFNKLCKDAATISKGVIGFFPERFIRKNQKDLKRVPALYAEISKSFEREAEFAKSLEGAFRGFAHPGGIGKEKQENHLTEA